MIASIVRVLRSTLKGDADHTAASTTSEQAEGLTRSEFLRVMAAGLVVGAVSSEQASAAKSSAVPPVTDINKLYDAWESRLNKGDLEGLLDLYLPDVLYVDPQGKEVTGQAAVRASFEGLIALKPEVKLGNRRHLVYRDIALTTNHWKLKINAPDGTRQEVTGGGIEVMRKQADGGWRYIIDDASRLAIGNAEKK